MSCSGDIVDDIVIVRIMLWLFALMMLGYVVGMILYGVDRFQHGSYAEARLALFAAFGPILALRSLRTSLHNRVHELRREIAVTQGQVMAPFARPQPESVSETAIATPIVIRLRQDWRYLAFFAVKALATFAFFGGVLLSAAGEDYWKSGFGLFALLFPFVAIGISFAVWVRFLRQELIASETGISLKQGFSTTIIPWSEARLFAVTGTYTPAPDRRGPEPAASRRA